MYELIIANKNYSSWSLRPWVLMRELGIPFTERLYPFGKAFNDVASLGELPARRVPVLQVDGLAVWDSLAIVEYLAERDERIWPESSDARAWARSAAAEMHASFASLREICAMNCGVRIVLHEITAGVAADLARIGELWDQGLTRFGGPYLAGQAFTAVDAFYAPVAFRLQTYGLSVGEAGDAYARRLLALPAMVQWYEQALTEVWRDVDHEPVHTPASTVTQDLRQSV